MNWLQETSQEFWLIIALFALVPLVAITLGRRIRFGQTRLLFLMPAVLIFGIFVVYPIYGSFFLSFTDANAKNLICADGRTIKQANADRRAIRDALKEAEETGTEPTYPDGTNLQKCEQILDYQFVGFENYSKFFEKIPRDTSRMFSGENLAEMGQLFDGREATRYKTPRVKEPFESLFNNLIWLLFFQLAIPLALGLAVLLNQTALFARLLKPAFFFPFVLSPVVISFLFQFVYGTDSGPLVWFYSLTGLGSDGILGSDLLATFGIIFAAWYPQIAYCTVIYLAGLTAVNPELIEAGSLDGARGLRLFRTVVFPQLWPATFICVVVTTIGALRSFDLVQVMTNGGVFTRVLALEVYSAGFPQQKLGYSSAVAVILFAIMLVFIAIFVRRMVQQVED